MSKLYFGDSIETMKLIKDKTIDCVICDLPYGTTQCSWDIIIPFDKLWEQYNRILKDNGVVLLFGVEPFSSHLRLSNLSNFKYDLIWKKERLTNVFQTKKQFGRIHEIISVFYKKQCKYNPIMEERKNTTTGVFGGTKTSKTHKNQMYKYSDTYDKTKKYPTTILKFNRDTLRGSIHPTQKPIKLLEYLIKTFSDVGDVILDNTCGSCSLAVACDNTQREWICIDNNITFLQDGLKRINDNRIKLGMIPIEIITI
jgi:site-specific DNA-methyltransferase (adenine-specific)